MKKLLTQSVAVFVLVVVLAASGAPAVHAKGGGGGRGGGGGARSAPKASAPKVSAPRAPVAPRVSAPRVTTRPSSTTRTVTAPKPITSGGVKFSTRGSVVDSTYKPSFSGYAPAAGSTVYYRQNSMWDYLPLYMILSHNSHRSAYIQEPATTTDGVTTPGATKVVKEDKVDPMYVWNWIFTILFFGGLIALAVYLINKRK